MLRANKESGRSPEITSVGQRPTEQAKKKIQGCRPCINVTGRRPVTEIAGFQPAYNFHRRRRALPYASDYALTGLGIGYARQCKALPFFRRHCEEHNGEATTRAPSLRGAERRSNPANRLDRHCEARSDEVTQ